MKEVHFEYHLDIEHQQLSLSSLKISKTLTISIYVTVLSTKYVLAFP